MSVQLRISRLWDPSPEELKRRADYRSWLSRQMRADLKVEERFAEGVSRRVIAKIARAHIKNTNQRKSRLSA